MPRVTRDDIDKFFDYEMHVPTRTIFVGSVTHSVSEGESGTDGAMAERVIKALHILDSSSESPITVIMNNPGGDYYHGLAIYDAIKACRSHVTIQVMGHAMSMGSYILQAADTRIVAPSSRIMIHYGYFSFSGHAKTGLKWAKESERLDEQMEAVLIEQIHKKIPRFPLAKLKKMLDHDTFIGAKEAVNLGLADKILGE